MSEHPREAEAPPVGEQVHMPSPSLLPFLNCVGLALAIVGITLSPVLLVGGLLLFLGTLIRWIVDVRRDIDDLPAEHH